MTDKRPINAWCRKCLECLENEREPECFIDIIPDHDPGDEDPKAWSQEKGRN
jgi:hypothetical protein